jgi:uridine kinase
MSNKKHFLIGIAGGSGSGKTTFLQAILNHFTTEEIALVSQDNYYRSKEEQEVDENGHSNFDKPHSIDRVAFFEDMKRLQRGEYLEKLEYTFNNPNATPKKVIVYSAPIIIMEGLFVFHYDEIREQLDYKVYVDVHHETRLERRIQRDAEHRGIPEHQVRYQWHNHVRPSEELYLEPYKPQCELVVDNTHSFDDGLEELLNVIKAQLH